MARFQWDPKKNASNKKKHGISFEDAVDVFKDPKRVTVVDDRQDYGEDRYNTTGFIPWLKSLVRVTHTPRGEETRIISARKPTKVKEIEEYRNGFGKR